MATDFDTFLDECNAEFDRTPTKKSDPKHARRKFTCHGQGFLVTSPEARAKARDYARRSKQSKIAAAQEANLAHGDGFLHQWLTSVASWNSFAASMIDQHNQGRTWSGKQVDACNRMYAKIKQRDEERAAAKAAREASAPVVDLTRIRTMFDVIMSHGYKRPMYRADGLRIKPGKAGALYVLNENRTEYGNFGEQPGYEGKITEDNKFFAVKRADADTANKLAVIAKDPLAAAIRYGKRTGRCSCCGRELTNDESIARGIGPICAERWGLGDVKFHATKEEAKADIADLIDDTEA